VKVEAPLRLNEWETTGVQKDFHFRSRLSDVKAIVARSDYSVQFRVEVLTVSRNVAKIMVLVHGYFRTKCVCLVAIALLANTIARSQTAATTPHVDSVAVFQQPQPSPAVPNQPSNFVLEITGTAFDTVDMANLRILMFPSTGVSTVTSLSRSTDNTKIFAQFTAPPNYALQEVGLSLTGTSFVTFSTGTESCDFENKVVVHPQIVSQSQSKTKYGNGVATNFHVVQISIVNKCSVPIIVPLAGMTIAPEGRNKTATSCSAEGGGDLAPFSLDHVTSIYSANRKLTGARAIYFNSLQALATLGSAVEPFFARGFTQGVAILGGGFTTASKEISVDMSTEQLQNITSQSFGATEQISSGGSLQKFIFIRRNQKCHDSIQEQNIRSGNFTVNLEMIAASAQAPATTSGKATPSAPAAQ